MGGKRENPRESEVAENIWVRNSGLRKQKGPSLSEKSSGAKEPKRLLSSTVKTVARKRQGLRLLTRKPLHPGGTRLIAAWQKGCVLFWEASYCDLSNYVTTKFEQPRWRIRIHLIRAERGGLSGKMTHGPHDRSAIAETLRFIWENLY